MGHPQTIDTGRSASLPEDGVLPSALLGSLQHETSVMARSIYSSPAGRTEVLALYEQAIDELGIQVDHLSVDTRFGHTHVLVAGPECAPPLVIFQGGNFLGPLSTAWFRPLMEEWRVYAPDTIGHPGRVRRHASRLRTPATVSGLSTC